MSTAADRAQAAIAALAATTASNAENLRQLVTTTAAAVAAQTANQVQEMTKRISALEMSMYEGKGKSTVADPMMSKLVDQMEAFMKTQTLGTGKTAGSQAMWGYVVAGFGFLSLLIGIAVALMKFKP